MTQRTSCWIISVINGCCRCKILPVIACEMAQDKCCPTSPCSDFHSQTPYFGCGKWHFYSLINISSMGQSFACSSSPNKDLKFIGWLVCSSRNSCKLIFVQYVHAVCECQNLKSWLEACGLQIRASTQCLYLAFM